MQCDQVASLRVEGVSISATARVTGHARHTIARWLERVSTAAKRFNQRMLRDFEIIELQADELCTFIGNTSRATWVCAAMVFAQDLGGEGDRSTATGASTNMLQTPMRTATAVPSPVTNESTLDI